ARPRARIASAQLRLRAAARGSQVVSNSSASSSSPTAISASSRSPGSRRRPGSPTNKAVRCSYARRRYSSLRHLIAERELDKTEHDAVAALAIAVGLCVCPGEPSAGHRARLADTTAVRRENGGWHLGQRVGAAKPRFELPLLGRVASRFVPVACLPLHIG